MIKPGFLLTKKIPLSLLRKTAGSYVDGDWVEGAEATVTIDVNIQPLKEAELLLLPEADRGKQWWKMYSASEIRMDKQGTSGWSADEFVYQGDRYKVMKVENYQMSILNHYKALAARMELSAE